MANHEQNPRYEFETPGELGEAGYRAIIDIYTGLLGNDSYKEAAASKALPIEGVHPIVKLHDGQGVYFQQNGYEHSGYWVNLKYEQPTRPIPHVHHAHLGDGDVYNHAIALSLARYPIHHSDTPDVVAEIITRFQCMSPIHEIGNPTNTYIGGSAYFSMGITSRNRLHGRPIEPAVKVNGLHAITRTLEEFVDLQGPPISIR